MRFAFIRGCADEVRAGHIDQAEAERLLVAIIRDLFTGRPET